MRFDYVANMDALYRNAHIMEDFDYRVETGTEDGIEALAERTYDMLRMNMAKYNLDFMNLASTIVINYQEKEFDILVTHPQADFIEHGTGRVGAQSPHRKPWYEWNYASGEFSSKGAWWYYDPSVNPYLDPDVIVIGSRGSVMTDGRPARPYMYDTWKWVRASGHQIIMSYINKKLAEKSKVIR